MFQSIHQCLTFIPTAYSSVHPPIHPSIHPSVRQSFVHQSFSLSSLSSQENKFVFLKWRGTHNKQHHTQQTSSHTTNNITHNKQHRRQHSTPRKKYKTSHPQVSFFIFLSEKNNCSFQSPPSFGSNFKARNPVLKEIKTLAHAQFHFNFNHEARILPSNWRNGTADGFL